MGDGTCQDADVHGRADILMTQEFLHGTNIITAFQEMGRKTMALILFTR